MYQHVKGRQRARGLEIKTYTNFTFKGWRPIHKPEQAPMKLPLRYIYWAEEDKATAVASVGTAFVDARPAAPKASPVAVAEKKNAAPAASRTVVGASCPQFSLSEGVDLFKAKCDLAQKK